MNLNEELKIISMANALDLDVQRPVEAIIEYCHAKVRKFLRRSGLPESIAELQEIICDHLNLTVHEIWNDNDITNLAAEYRDQGELAVFAAISTQLKPDTFGILIQLQRATITGQTRFVAFIDCRGEKQLKRVFTLWHEIAHCLTAKNQLALPLRRTTAEIIEKDPVEKLTDMIAAEFAFYGPLFRPIFDIECGENGRLDFSVVERVRTRFNPDASFGSTLNACVTNFHTPAILIEAGLAYKLTEQRKIDSGTAEPSDFAPSLRVLRSIPNKAARAELPHIPKHMRVPEGSMISRIFESDEVFAEDEKSEEDLCTWSSQGRNLKSADVRVEARRIGGRVFALISARTD